MQSKITLSTVCKKYLQVNKRIEESTANLTRQAFAKLISSAGDIEISQLAFDGVEQFQAELIDNGLKRTSANIYIKTIRPVFNWSVNRGFIKASPFDKLKLFKIMRKRVVIFTPYEIERMLHACPNIIWKAIVLLGLTSMRRGEVLNLTIRDIDFDRNVVLIEPKEETAYTWRWQPKDHDRRSLPLIPQASKLLAEIHGKMPSGGQPYLLLTPARYSYLLMNRASMNDRTKKCPDNNFNRTFQGICQRAFIKGSFHMLRKTALTQLASGMRLQEVQEIAGHSDIKTTEAYLARGSNMLQAAREILKQSLTI